MDFISGLPLTPTKKDLVWVIVDQLTKSPHFLPIDTNYSLHRLARLYILEIVRLYGVPLSIIFDQDPWFTYQFLKKMHKAFQNRLKFSVAFHLQADGKSEWVIQILEDILRGCVIDFNGS